MDLDSRTPCGDCRWYCGHPRRAPREDGHDCQGAFAPGERRPQGLSRPEDTLRGGIITASLGAALLLAQALGHLSSWLFVPAFILIFAGGAIVASLFLRKYV